MSSFHGIGLMSGTSMDGLDICFAEFTGDVDTDVWGYRILKCLTVPYTDNWLKRLKQASELSGLELIKLHVDYGRYLGEAVSEFIESEDIKPDFVASHGHTIFHQPQHHLTFQLGEGETTAAYLKSTLVCNFRSKDVALGGQGAPLVPSGERYLFGNVDLCINLGGIANVSLRGENGYDACACNIVLNMLASQHDSDLSHDVDGEIGQSGEILQDVLKQLEALQYYQKAPPKSMGLEWVEKNIYPILDTNKYSTKDLLCTYAEHIAVRVAQACAIAKDSPIPYSVRKSSAGNRPTPLTVLVTGGGAFNTCLMDRLKKKLKEENIVLAETDIDTIQFKEALLFAFLGLRCLLGVQNVSSSVTGSSMDSVSGSIHLPPGNILNPLSPKSNKLAFKLKRQNSKST